MTNKPNCILYHNGNYEKIELDFYKKDIFGKISKNDIAFAHQEDDLNYISDKVFGLFSQIVKVTFNKSDDICFVLKKLSSKGTGLEEISEDDEYLDEAIRQFQRFNVSAIRKEPLAPSINEVADYWVMGKFNVYGYKKYDNLYYARYACCAPLSELMVKKELDIKEAPGMIYLGNVDYGLKHVELRVRYNNMDIPNRILLGHSSRMGFESELTWKYPKTFLSKHIKRISVTGEPYFLKLSPSKLSDCPTLLISKKTMKADGSIDKTIESEEIVELNPCESVTIGNESFEVYLYDRRKKIAIIKRTSESKISYVNVSMECSYKEKLRNCKDSWKGVAEELTIVFDK